MFKQGKEWNGNRKGRPAGSISLTTILKSKLQEVPQGQKRTWAEIVIDKMLHKAVIEGNTDMLKYINDRIDGKPEQSVTGSMKLTMSELLDEIGSLTE